ncbi:hypothetical protein EXU57_21295 [Segetibacter sp. 3557_3]|uniref:sensor histidine kinase n=1 Tax=Segetibacter sp. 3557_3 TaxID=2547429 RepID=UPI001058ECCE|nr:sensor histidine kinase [Segetibacter sp. 3557_3]TDH20655.1 hypothetical protein EXU57_21295 [Segetibacter sp. 3557_3]
MRGITIVILLLCVNWCAAQKGFAFSHITTDDGTGLGSNLVTSLHQDNKGFIWVGTANGLQRFDGSKFVQVTTTKVGGDRLLYPRISQILPGDSGKLVLAMFSLREVGIFDPSTYLYRKIALKPLKKIPTLADFRLWKDSENNLYMTVSGYGILQYDKGENAFRDSPRFKFPPGWKPALLGTYEHLKGKQYWFACDSGLCIYNKQTGEMWYNRNNPAQLAILQKKEIRSGLQKVYIDRLKRIWIFLTPETADGSRYRYCFDSTGTRSLTNDTLGLNYGIGGATEYKHFFETREGSLWIYGFDLLLNYDNSGKRFRYIKNSVETSNNAIDYESVFQLLEDREGNIWIATNNGLYYTATASANSSVVNVSFTNRTGPTSINDILELPNGDLWFTSWHRGVTALTKRLEKIDHPVYQTPPPTNWNDKLKQATVQTLSMCRQRSGTIWIGCNYGVIMRYDPVQNTTTFLHPSELGNSPIQYMVEDRLNQVWFATQAGYLVKWSNDSFKVVKDVGTMIHKLFIDSDGWVWLATRAKGLYALDPTKGEMVRQYTADTQTNALYSNTVTDVEQLNNNTIVFAAGALHFADKKTKKIRTVGFEDGLPSNTVTRLRMDRNGFLWLITSNGLSRYNPGNNRVTSYGRKDGVIVAEQAIAADYRTRDGQIIFGGSSSVIMFNPVTFSESRQPLDVTITDLKLFNRYLPVDSLMKSEFIRLNPDENALTIYFASLSYRQRDKLTYYYKMEGVDKGWLKADRSYQVNYSLLPSGKYRFQVFCENIEGVRSKNITSLNIYIKPPFWKTGWFITSVLFVLAILIYAIHDLRVNRILAVENLRNKVARDLHDDMGSTLSTISILSAMAENKMNVDNGKSTEYIRKISVYSERMMEAMDDIVWSIKPSNDSMQRITARLREFATNVLEAKDMDFEFIVNENVDNIRLNMEARRDLFLVFKEAVNNAAKYSKANKVVIQLSMRKRELELSVIDDGVGFEMAEADGNGLGNMRKRADNLNGKLSIETKKLKGTKIRLVIPIQ